MNRTSRVASATGIAVVGIALSAGTAVASGTLLSAGPGTLSLKGARASVPVTMTCTLGENFSVYIDLNERVGGGQLASGAGNTYATYGYQPCTGEPQTVVVEVSPYNRAFKTGTAAGQGSITSCSPDFSFCESQSFSTEVQLKNN